MTATIVPVQTSEMKQRRGRQLIYLIYIQAFALALTYAAGVMVTFGALVASITTPQIIEHGLLASSFGVSTALVALVAGIQGMKRVSIYNIVLFAVTVVGGASGFAFLGNNTTFATYETTNMLMTIVIAVGMPVTGVSLALVSKSLGGVASEENGGRIPLVMTFVTLGALALTLIAGVGMTSSPYPSAMKTAHFGFAGLTLAAVLALAFVTIRRSFGRHAGSYPRSTSWLPFSILSLLSFVVAVGLGAAFLFMGDLTYVVGMADLSLLVYLFLLFGIQPPLHGMARWGMRMNRDPVKFYAVVILLLQALATVVLWVLDVLSTNTTAAFEILLAANLASFAIIVHVYRNPDYIARPEQPQVSVPAGVAPPSESQSSKEMTAARGHFGPALPKWVHVVIPLASVAVLLAFAIVTFMPSDKSPIPPTSTSIFVPVYLTIVVVLVLGSLYLFKRLMDTEASSPTH